MFEIEPFWNLIQCKRKNIYLYWSELLEQEVVICIKINLSLTKLQCVICHQTKQNQTKSFLVMSKSLRVQFRLLVTWNFHTIVFLPIVCILSLFGLNVFLLFLVALISISLLLLCSSSILVSMHQSFLQCSKVSLSLFLKKKMYSVYSVFWM